MHFFRSIRSGIITLFSILVFITFFTIIAFFIYERQIRKVEINLNTINQINESIIKLSALERDLFIFEAINPDFYKNNSDNFLLEKKIYFKNLISQINLLKNQSNFLGEKNQNVLTLESNLEKYRILYDSTASVIKQKGWKDYGVEGIMRSLIHSIENTTCKIDMRLVLMIRRHEKDFLLRKQERYVELLIQVNEELKENIVQSCSDKNKRETLLNWQSDYENAFLMLVELEKNIGYTNIDGLKGELSKQIETLNTNLKYLNSEYLNEAEKIRKLARAFMLSVLFLALILNIFVVSFLIRKLGNPIKKLTLSIINSVNNNFDKNFEIEKIQSNDEIGKLSASFEYMLKNVHERTDLIMQKNDQIEKSFEELKRLSKLGREIASKLESDAVIQKAFKAVNKLISFDFFTVGLIDKDEQKLNFVHYEKSVDLFSSTTFRQLSDHNSLTVYSYIHQKRIIINDISLEYVNYLQNMPNDDGDELFHSLIYLPLTYLDTKLGVMIIKKREKYFFSQFDYNLLKNLALYISLALQNSDTYKTLQTQTSQIEKQKSEMQLQNDQITASIRQARTMQLAILPTKEHLEKGFDFSLLYRPKDIVSGDFYWFKKIEPNETNPENAWIYAVVDCTGHGVPGALLTLIGTNLLEEIVNKEQNYNPASILEMMDERIRIIFKQEENFESKDGMDVALCKITPKSFDKYHVIFSGAKRPLYFFKHKTNEIVSIKGSRRTIGGTAKISKDYFINQSAELTKGDVIFLTTDGYVDQHDIARKRFGTGKFIKLIEEIAPLSTEIQHRAMEKILETYIQNEEQRDDITVLSLKL